MINSKAVKDLFHRFVIYENYIQQETISYQIDPSIVPPGYLTVFSQNKDAYLFYRNSLLLLLKKAEGEHELYYELLNFTLHTVKLIGYKDFETFADSLYDKFKIRWDNTVKTSHLVSELGMQKLELNNITLNAYQHKYEIEEVLIYLAILIKAVSKNTFDQNLDNFKDKSGNLRKGKIIEYIISGLDSFPNLKKTISKAYNPNLRNIIGHNDYKIKDNSLFTIDDELIITNHDFIEAFYSMQELHNALIWTISNIEINKNVEEYSDCGVLAIGYYYNKEIDIPEIHLFQLWCFSQCDPEKKWLKKAQIYKDKKNITTKLTDICVFSGEITSEIDKWFKRAELCKKVQIHLIPIVPFIGLDTRTILIINEKYQIYEEPYSTIIPVDLVEM